MSYYENNKDKIKQYSKEYYQNNKDKIKKYPSQQPEYKKEANKKYDVKRYEYNRTKILCSCGCMIMRCKQSQHEKTKKHVNLMKQ